VTTEIDYGTVFERAPRALAVVEAETGRLLDVNDRFCSVFDRSRDALVGDTWAAVTAGDSDLLSQHRATLSEGESVDCEVCVRPPEGDPFAVDVELSTLGADALLAGVSEASERSQCRQVYENVVDTSPVPIWIQRGETIAYANEAAASFHGVDGPGDLEGRSALSFVVREEREETRERIQRVHEEFHPLRTIEGRVETADGRIRHGLFAGAPVTYRGDDAIIVIAEDITEQKRRERRLLRQNEQLDRFASIVSHDLRAPLNVVRGHLELARETGAERHFEQVETSLDRIEAIVDDVLTMARNGAKVTDEAYEWVDLSTVVDRATATAPTECATVEVDGDLRFRADPDRLRRALENLFRNAAEHAGPETRVVVGPLSERDGCGFYVADDGPGIPEAKREEILERGYTDGSGTGLGLAIVSNIVTAHGWDLHVTESDLGGTRFEMTDVEC
jgi:PAS domain S-box-containing protein